ncbi:hypothetical protein ACIBHY_32635 [Nonomuraea sp. NPDC050547]|uniref:hypothetical protein n=1 Tax=Nonomuraea sp. NPDC050547 TaxID=3364368 RepID=UPI00379B324D
MVIVLAVAGFGILLAFGPSERSPELHYRVTPLSPPPSTPALTGDAAWIQLIPAPGRTAPPPPSPSLGPAPADGFPPALPSTPLHDHTPLATGPPPQDDSRQDGTRQTGPPARSGAPVVGDPPAQSTAPAGGGAPAQPAQQAPDPAPNPGHNPCATFQDIRRDYCDRLLGNPG